MHIIVMIHCGWCQEYDSLRTTTKPKALSTFGIIHSSVLSLLLFCSEELSSDKTKERSGNKVMPGTRASCCRETVGKNVLKHPIKLLLTMLKRPLCKLASEHDRRQKPVSSTQLRFSIPDVYAVWMLFFSTKFCETYFNRGFHRLFVGQIRDHVLQLLF